MTMMTTPIRSTDDAPVSPSATIEMAKFLGDMFMDDDKDASILVPSCSSLPSAAASHQSPSAAFFDRSPTPKGVVALMTGDQTSNDEEVSTPSISCVSLSSTRKNWSPPSNDVLSSMDYIDPILEVDCRESVEGLGHTETGLISPLLGQFHEEQCDNTITSFISSPQIKQEKIDDRTGGKFGTENENFLKPLLVVARSSNHLNVNLSANGHGSVAKISNENHIILTPVKVNHIDREDQYLSTWQPLSQDTGFVVLSRRPLRTSPLTTLSYTIGNKEEEETAKVGLFDKL
jgi:hypothetical protein